MRRRGGAAAFIVAIITVALLAAAAWFAAEAVKRRSFDKGSAMLAGGDYAQAAAYFERAGRFSIGDDARVLAALGAAREGLGDAAGAKDCYERAAKADGKNVDARSALGKIYIKEKNFEAARSEIAALEKIGTDEARGKADELRTEMQLGSVKSIFDGIINKVLPELGIGDKKEEERQ